MASYQLRRPSPIKVVPKRARRGDAVASTMPVPENEEKEGYEEQEGPESPDSLASSPSTVGEQSDSEDSESEDEEEPPSTVESGASSTTTRTLGATPTSAPSLPTKSGSLASSLLSFTVNVTSRGSSTALPQITGTTLSTRTRTAVTSTVIQDTSQSERQKQASTISSVPPPPPPLSTAEPELSGESGAPQRSFPQQEERPIMTKGAAVAATVLGALGAVALLIGAVVLFKRRKRKQDTYNQHLSDDVFNPSNTGSLHAPETAHVGSAASIFGRLNGGGSGGDTHLTRFTDRSNTLFGAGTCTRPATMSTEHASRLEYNILLPTPLALALPTPNPFNDPPLNKAYDVLNNRPRSTTLTDRGSWEKNPFKDPESERFDPFGELKEKARQERQRCVLEARRAAERERQKQLEMKKAMGLGPDDPAVH